MLILPDVSQADGALHIATTTVETLMQQADSAMYKVKRAGKNKVQLAGEKT